MLLLGAAYGLPMPQAPTPPSGAGIAALPGVSSAVAQQQRALTVDDYTRWRHISGEALSGDGKWVIYELRYDNRPPDESEPELRLQNLATGDEVVIANGGGGQFSKDSRWLAYQVDPSGAAGGRGGRGRGGAAPQGRGGNDEEPSRVELRNLETGDVRSWQNIQSFSFSDASTHLLLRRRPPQAEGGGRGRGGSGGQGNGEDQEQSRGVDVILHDLGTRRDQLLGSVGDAAFNKVGDLLAYTVDATVDDANGLFVLELSDARLIALDNSAMRYSQLTWNDEGTSLAALKGTREDGMRERANVLIAFPDVRAAIAGGAATVLDPATAAGFPDGWVISENGDLAWSDDGARVFFGTREQEAEAADDDSDEDDEAANVDIWNTSDDRIQSVQMRQANRDRNFTYRQALDVASGGYVALADESMRDIDVAPQGKWAVGTNEMPYLSDFLPTEADFYRVDTTTGDRTLILDRQLAGRSAVCGFTPDGSGIIYWKDEEVQLYDLDALASRTLGGDTAPSFIDTEDDHPGPRPWYGVAGFTADGEALVMQHRYDLWLLPLDGSDAHNLTNGAGAADEIRFRYVDPVPSDTPFGGACGSNGRPAREIDLSAPVTLSAYGQWTKKDGFYRLDGGELTPVVYEDASFSNPERAADADVFLFTRQTFVEFPDLRVSGPDFSDSRKITDANPQQAEFNWGHRILFDFENNDGMRLQGIMALPDDYQQGEKRPMIVTFYEKNSQNLHRYTSPSYLTGMGSSPIQAVSEGYITMLPDIHFRTGASHSDMLECVEAAVRKVIEMGYVDPEHIAVTGHSYGGEGAAFIGTRSKLFAAVGMGAGVTDLYSDFNQNWGWTYNIDGGSGANGHAYYLYGQGREAVTPWENPELYRFESAITHVPEVRQPFLIVHGTDDPTVAFQNGLGFYNALRLNDKTAILLAYPGEGHGLRRLANRRDLTIRYFEFFNHYLKGAPAPEWMTEGVSYLEKDGQR
jgi:dipeptidyl aminopeptidase/acylaminoacyl peptidase